MDFKVEARYLLLEQNVNCMNINSPILSQQFKVLVRCFTYNQSKYIVDTLNGFAMQQTNFPFVCLVMDDASTDSEREVIKDWMECECDMSKTETLDIPTSNVILVPHKTNASCIFAFYLLKKNLYNNEIQKMELVNPWRERSEYEALCEGDDYWIDSTKLQKQVNFLEENLEYGMCYTQCRYFYQNSNMLATTSWGGRSTTFEELFFQNTVPTATVVCRQYLVKKYNEDIRPYEHRWKLGDYPFWLYLSKESKICFFNDVTSVYRVLDESASHSRVFEASDAFINSIFDMKLFFSKYYHFNADLNDYKYKSLALNAFRLRNRLKTVDYIKEIKQKNVSIYLLFFVALLPPLFHLCSYITSNDVIKSHR